MGHVSVHIVVGVVCCPLIVAGNAHAADPLGIAPTYAHRPLGPVPNEQAITKRIWVPGLDDGYVPQGLTIVGGALYVSSYRSEDPKQSRGPCRLYKLDMATGATKATLDLPPSCGHAGGLAKGPPRRLFVADTRVAYEVVLAEGEGSAIGRVARSFELEGEVRGSFALRFETEATKGKPIDDIREVSNYVDAMMYGLERLADLPLSLRLVREMHQRLLQSGRGQTKNPGEFRRSQNWIGGTRPGNAMFVPPPPNEMMPALGDLERFIHHDAPALPPLIKAGLTHVQFETIHPFLDGNGRLGRLLIALYLCSQRVLQQPLLYWSLYFKARRSDYYRLLQEVRETGAWEEWLEFFLDGVAQTANQAFEAATRINALIRGDRELISSKAERPSSTLRVQEVMQTLPFISAPKAVERTKLTMPTVGSALAQLQKLGIIKEITNRRRGRIYAYTAYLDILNEGDQPLDQAAAQMAVKVSRRRQ